MIKKYLIEVLKGPRKGLSFSVSMNEKNEIGELRFPDEAAIDAWFDRKMKKETFGKPERDYIYKIEYYKLTPGGNEILHLTKDFPLDPEYDEDIMTMGEAIEERPGGKQKRFIYRLKAEYKVTTSDMEADLLAEEQVKDNKKTRKETRKNKLKGIDWSKKTTVASVKNVIKDLIEHLGIDDGE